METIKEWLEVVAVWIIVAVVFLILISGAWIANQYFDIPEKWQYIVPAIIVYFSISSLLNTLITQNKFIATEMVTLKEQVSNLGYDSEVNQRMLVYISDHIDNRSVNKTEDNSF